MYAEIHSGRLDSGHMVLELRGNPGARDRADDHPLVVAGASQYAIGSHELDEIGKGIGTCHADFLNSCCKKNSNAQADLNHTDWQFTRIGDAVMFPLDGCRQPEPKARTLPRLRTVRRSARHDG